MRLIGSKITRVRPMTKREMRAEGWDGQPPLCLVLDNGAIIFPSRDHESNGPGILFGRDKGLGFHIEKENP